MNSSQLIKQEHEFNFKAQLKHKQYANYKFCQKNHHIKLKKKIKNETKQASSVQLESINKTKNPKLIQLNIEPRFHKNTIGVPRIRIT